MLRELIETDLPQVLVIEQATQNAPWTQETFERCFNMGYRGWVIVQENKLLGFVIVSFVMGECHILNLCVHPECQRQGLGRELLSHALHTSKQMGAGMAYLEVRLSNKPAIGLCHWAGFVQIGHRKGYYPHPTGREDALVFAKDLTVE